MALAFIASRIESSGEHGSCSMWANVFYSRLKGLPAEPVAQWLEEYYRLQR